MVSTAFENQYDGKLNGGSSVVNHFEFTPNEKTADDQKQSAEDGVWDWEQQTGQYTGTGIRGGVKQ